ncbi:MAG: acyl carrier protein [Nitrospirota bacterium]|jgi:acyl carrier protein
MSEIKQKAKAFILEKFLQGASEDELQDTTPLITSGILDSLGTVALVEYLEETFKITIQAHEADEDSLGTLNDIERLVQSKL